MDEPVKPVVVFSKCLGFDRCRYNGETINDSFVQKLAPLVEARTVCPEAEIGLGVPRHPIHVISSGGDLSLVQPETGTDVTRRMLHFCDSFLGSLDDVDGFILKSRSTWRDSLRAKKKLPWAKGPVSSGGPCCGTSPTWEWKPRDG